jgi:hypothetical protein
MVSIFWKAGFLEGKFRISEGKVKWGGGGDKVRIFNERKGKCVGLC